MGYEGAVKKEDNTSLVVVCFVGKCLFVMTKRTFDTPSMRVCEKAHNKSTYASV